MADIKNIKKIKIGENTYNIRDDSVSSQISTAVGNLNSSATVASESSGTITITKTVAETAGKIGNGTGSTTTYTTAKIEDLVQRSKDYADGLIGGLGTIMKFKGTVANETTLKAIKGAKKGEVYVVTADGSE